VDLDGGRRGQGGYTSRLRGVAGGRKAGLAGSTTEGAPIRLPEGE
jgi:hypothetical protein